MKADRLMEVKAGRLRGRVAVGKEGRQAKGREGRQAKRREGRQVKGRGCTRGGKEHYSRQLPGRYVSTGTALVQEGAARGGS